RPGPHASGEPGVLRLDDPISNRLGSHPLDAALDHRRRDARRVVARPRRPAHRHRRRTPRRMNPPRSLLYIYTALLAIAPAQQIPAPEPTWQKAAPGWRYEWPRDHGPHRDFKTEWWYFTGNLRAKDGRRFGYQLTFFRQGVRPPGAAETQSRF